MDRKKLLLNLVILMFLMFAAHSIATKFYWYSSIWYFDMIMHFFGGFWVGLFFTYVFSLGSLSSSGELFLKSVFKIILCVLVIGVLWEFFEVFTNNYIAGESFNVLDTFSDIFFDLAGGAAAIFYCYNYYHGKSR